MSANANTQRRLLSIPEFCRETNTGRTKVYDLLATGELSAVKLGRLTRITAEERDRYLASLPPYVADTNRSPGSVTEHVALTRTDLAHTALTTLPPSSCKFTLVAGERTIAAYDIDIAPEDRPLIASVLGAARGKDLTTVLEFVAHLSRSRDAAPRGDA